MSASATSRRVSVVGCDIDALTFDETLAEVERLIAARLPAQHCVVNAAKAVLMDGDPILKGIVSSCALINADGQSVVWASRVLGAPLPERVAGIDLFQALLAVATLQGYGVYFLGASSDVLGVVLARARLEHSALRICGWHDGYWDADEAGGVIAQVRDARPDMLFVGMPSPRKEYWLAEHLEELGVPFSMGVGGSFDVYAGKVKRAPPLLQRAGLEWAFRLCQEPARMWRRYLLGNVAFLWLVARYFCRDVVLRCSCGDRVPGGRGPT